MTVPAVSVVVPAFNESQNLRSVIDEIENTLLGAGIGYEVVIIDDGSTDETQGLCGALIEASPRLRAIRHPANLGLGGVYRTGFAEARGENIIFLPGDGQFAPEIVLQFLPLMRELDMVLGYYPTGDRPVLGRVLSKCEQVVHRIILGRVPTFRGVLMFRRALLSQVTLRSEGRGWGILFELILKVHRAGFKVASVATGVRPRLSGRSKVNNMRTIMVNLVQVYRLSRDLS
jgi:glycosyltransferase involved in cell wall biosynthesis